MLDLFRQRRRRKLLEDPFPEVWDTIIRGNVAVDARLAPEERQLLRVLTRVFIRETDFEAGPGIAISDQIRVTIAAQACVLLLGTAQNPLRDDVFQNVKSVIVYPGGYVAPHQRMLPDGSMTYAQANLGEAWPRGPVIVSWRDSLLGARGMLDGRNLVLHEFAHKLDMIDGAIDGTPPLPPLPTLPGNRAHTCWKEVMTDAYNRLREDAAARRRGVIDFYGATNPAEFFATATEAFFERPLRMREEQPRLYGVLMCAYKQDPATRHGAPAFDLKSCA